MLACFIVLVALIMYVRDLFGGVFLEYTHRARADPVPVHMHSLSFLHCVYGNAAAATNATTSLYRALLRYCIY